MPRKTIHFAAFFVASLLGLPAQQPGQSASSPDHGVNGITIPAIPGQPFSATVVIEIELEWPEGYTEVRRTINLIARDSIGRTHNETRRLMPEYFHGSPLLMTASLFDPQTRIRTVYDPTLHMASQQAVPNQPTTAKLPDASVRIEDLGASTLNGLPTKGTRRTFTLSSKASGVGEPVQIEDEEWYSEELHLNLLVRHSDPRIGTQTIGVSNLKREEPLASMFEVPKGYRILNLTPSPIPAPAHPPNTQKPSADPTS